MSPSNFNRIVATNFVIKGATANRPAFINAAGIATNASGTPDGTKFVRDDGVLAVPSGSAAQVWTNDGAFTWPRGTPAPGSIPGPPFFFRTDGSLFIGTNIAEDFGISNYSYLRPFSALSMLDSNQPAAILVELLVNDNSNDYDLDSDITFQVKGHDVDGYANFSCFSYGTNGNTTGIQFIANPSGSDGGTKIQITTNFNPVFKVVGNGNISDIRGVSGYSWPTAHVAGSLTNDGSGNLGWGSGGSGGISSVYSNNVLAGSSLTQLGFTNTSTVTVAISSNANRATVSLTAIGDGVGIATQGGSGTNTTLVTFSSITGTNATAQALNVTSTQTNTGVIGQTAPLQQWNNSNATQSASIASNGVLVLQSNIVAVLFGLGASAGNVGLKNNAGVLEARTGSDSTYTGMNVASISTFGSSSGVIIRGGVGSLMGFNGQWFFGNPAQGVAELYNDSGTAAMTNRIWGSRTNSTTGWWLEEGYAADFGWHFVRTRGGTSAAKSLAIGVSTNADLVVDTAHKVSVGTGVADGGGLKHGRVTTGSINLGSTALVTLTWASAFADANYTVSAEVEDSTTTSLALSVVHVESKTTTNVAVRIINNSATTAITGVLNVLAIHD